MASGKNTWPLKPLLGSQQAINQYPIKQGQLLIRKYGGALYFDQDDETRILVANVGGGGSGGDPQAYTHNQSAASDTWVINHNLGFNPSVTIVDSAGTNVIGEIEYNTVNKLTLHFSSAFGGTAYCS